MSKTTYLIVADGSEEFNRSKRYAALAAKRNNADLSILHILPKQDFQIWMDVQERMKNEQTRTAELYLQDIIKDIKTISGIDADYHIESGSKTDAVLKTLKNNPTIKKLIVTTSTSKGEKGAILSYFTGTGSTKLPITLTIVPGHVPMKDIDKLVE